MKQRCCNPRYTHWLRYGGRGITVCPEWASSYEAFARDMGERPPGHTLERIDNDKGYSPENCRWATRKEQARNRANTSKIVIEGREFVAAELAEISGLKTDTIKDRAFKLGTLSQIIDPEKRHNLSGFAMGAAISSAKRKERTHCRRGHLYTDASTGIQKGGRYCRTCRNARLANQRRET